MGCGMAAIYATGLLWIEKYVRVTNAIGAAYSFCAMFGPDVFPIIIGTFIVDKPMSLMYYVLTSIVFLTVLFVIAGLVGESIVRSEKAKALKEQQQQMQMQQTKTSPPPQRGEKRYRIAQAH